MATGQGSSFRKRGLDTSKLASRASESKATAQVVNQQTSRAVTSLQNYDETQKQNLEAVNKVKEQYETIAQEYRAGKITDESIKSACEKKNIDPTPILEFVKMSNLEKEQSPYYKSDLSSSPILGTSYNGTLKNGQSVTVAGCEITAKEYTGKDAVKGTSNVYGLEKEKNKKKAQILRDESAAGTIVDGFSAGFTTIGHAITSWFTDDPSSAVASPTEDVAEDDYVPESRTLYHCKSDYLGEFDYDPTIYRIGYKEVKEPDGSTSQLPVLQYIGGDMSMVDSYVGNLDGKNPDLIFNFKVHGDLITDTRDALDNLVPKGCKVLDYTFAAGNGGSGNLLDYLPVIPEGVTSIHCAFKGDTDLESFPEFKSENEFYANISHCSSRKINILPSTLECASCAFQDCSSLNGFFFSREYAEQTVRRELNEAYNTPATDTASAQARQSKIDSLETRLSIIENGANTGIGELNSAIEKVIGRRSQVVDQLPYGVVNTMCMFSGCTGLDELYYDGITADLGWAIDIFDRDSSEAMTFDRAKFGGNLTPYLAPDLMAGIYDDIADKTAMASGYDADTGKFKDSSAIKDTVVDEYGDVRDGKSAGGLDDTKLNQTRAAQMTLAEGEVDAAMVKTSVELASDGFMKNNYIKDTDGTYKYDATGRKRSLQDLLPDSAASWESWVQAMAIGSIAGVITKGVTKNKLAAIGATAAGTLISKNYVASSLYPMVSWAAEKLNSDWLRGIADKLPGAAAYKKNKEINEYNKALAEKNGYWDNDYNLGQENYSKRISGAVGAMSNQTRVSMLVDNNCTEYMFANGQAAAQELNFAGVAVDGENCLTDVRDIMTKMLDVAEADFKKCGSYATDAKKKEMSEYYTKLLESMEAYSRGATTGIEYFDNDSIFKTEVQMDGLGMVNRTCVEEIMTSLKEMNDKYQFMSDADWSKVSKLKIDGVDTANLKNYTGASYFAEARNYAAGKTVQDIRSLRDTDKEFKIATDDKIAAIDARLPEGWTETVQDNISATRTDDTQIGAQPDTSTEATTVASRIMSAVSSAKTKVSDKYKQTVNALKGVSQSASIDPSPEEVQTTT